MNFSHHLLDDAVFTATKTVIIGFFFTPTLEGFVKCAIYEHTKMGFTQQVSTNSSSFLHILGYTKEILKRVTLKN